MTSIHTGACQAQRPEPHPRPSVSPSFLHLTFKFPVRHCSPGFLPPLKPCLLHFPSGCHTQSSVVKNSINLSSYSSGSRKSKVSLPGLQLRSFWRL